MPGQSGFYFDESTLISANGSKKKLGQSLQILPHTKFGYRSYVQKYKLKKDTCAAISVAKNQNVFKFGAGGGTQYFMSDFATKLSKVGTLIVLK